MAPPDALVAELPPLALDTQLRRFSRRANALLCGRIAATSAEVDELRVSGFALAVLLDSAVADLRRELERAACNGADARWRGRRHLGLRRLRREARSLRVYLYELAQVDEAPPPPSRSGGGPVRVRGS